MVDLEQTLEQVGVLDLRLQDIQQLDLPVHQPLQPTCEADVHLYLLPGYGLASGGARLGADVRSGESMNARGRAGSDRYAGHRRAHQG
ncbi:hypothetical protein GCM10011608_11630 [Micromonospora sonchi]|uniref:Uncharacterized protein n=1 Tax=Micromonospora sonchi TaxID=1763543 RepID=A0A917WTR3_9ACTN|nr:hypothetical protein GCM10011608_11630 [Micromonospora sonchi]